MTKGWAVKDPGGINIKTVSDTRRAAIVNWLYVEGGIPIFSYTTDEEIERKWRENCGASEAVEVTVTRTI